ncbi:MAG: hypothetical protein PHF46_02975 [Candidatus Gracilibacteria bacterium]|nr:hypothetical protein [Candidatus Gracilibacteria bacterium]MDD3120347.1 hypothetical protein [Candidatus Gracilibacteria bacterium]MDD4530349.1 hypothetical protein [Candidatus Gracilibacteria bacterium]
MKKLLKYLIFLISILGSINFTFATSGTVVYTTESLPGLVCNCISKDCTNVVTRKYECQVLDGFSGFLITISKILKYSVFIISLLSVLIIIVSGIQLSLSGISSKAKDGAKQRIFRVISGLMVLFFFGLILHLIAPWIY